MTHEIKTLNYGEKVIVISREITKSGMEIVICKRFRERNGEIELEPGKALRFPADCSFRD